MIKAKQVLVKETSENGTVNICFGIQVGNKLIFAGNGDIIDLSDPHIEVIEHSSWADVFEVIIGQLDKILIF